MDDLISRQEAIDALIRKMKPHDNGDGTMTIYVMSERLVKETLNDLPVAQQERCEDCENFSKTRLLIPQPERIKGHWVEIASSNHTYKCSVCGRLLVNITDGKNNVAKNYPYCHCGADMRGGK